MVAVRSLMGVAALAVFQLLFISGEVVQAQDGVEVHVMSFNVRTSYASEDAKSTCSNWDGVRKENAANQIRTVAPDFVGTQETSEPQKGFLDGALASQYLSIGRYSGSLNGKAGEVNAIYYKLADWKSLGDGMFWLGPNPDAMSAAWSMDYYRTAVWGRFQHIKSGLTVCVFNTHYETPGKTEAQNQASGIILSRMATICQPTDKLTVMTGDFNAQPGESAIKKLLDGGLSEPSVAATYCGDMISPTCATKFDYTFHKLADGACYKTSEVLRTAFGGCYTSDHAPLLGTFCLGGSCCGATPTPTPSPSPSPGAGSGSTSSSAGSSASATGSFAGSAANEENVLPGTVSAGKDSGLVGNDALAGGATTAGGGAGTAGGSSAATPSGDGPATQASTSSSTSGSNATGTFMAVFGVVGAVALVALVVVRKKRALDSRLDSEKTASAPMVPSYFTRGDDVGSEADLSPLPRITEQSALERQSNSPIPTLWAGEKKERDSRSSSLSYKGYSPGSQYDSRSSSTNFSVRMSSAVLLDDASTYSRSPSYDARMQESRINFSEAFVADSFDSDDGGALTKSRTDFAML